MVHHGRTIRITRFRHVDLPNKDKPALLVKGVVTAPDFADCANNVPVKVQIRAGGEWVTRKADVTNNNGVFKVLFRDVAARYRARATRFEIADPAANLIHVCQKVTHARRHGH
ncbi:MAG: hypothetical protein M3349_09785 [Actinomycetota bacterium]|nr:hypothetical protein [Actinomycetota bacterium]